MAAMVSTPTTDSIDLDLVCRLVAVDPLNEALRQLREALDANR
jgi:hypothetical protein